MKLTAKECLDRIKASDMVLIGLGKEFEPDFKETLKFNPIYNRFKDDIDSIDETEGLWLEYGIYYHELISAKNPVIQSKLEYLNKLAGLIGDKNIFVVTTCTLDVVRLSNLNQGRIVAPCGTVMKMECHLGCKKDVYSSVETLEKIYGKLESMYRDDKFDKQYIMQFIPICDKCEAAMEPNQLKLVSYSEEGYIEKWELYNKWLSGTINRNLVLLELGVDFDTPTVIRWPFEMICMINQKSLLLRINSKFAMLTPEIAEKAVAFSKSSCEFIDELLQAEGKED